MSVKPFTHEDVKLQSKSLSDELISAMNWLITENTSMNGAASQFMR